MKTTTKLLSLLAAAVLASSAFGDSLTLSTSSISNGSNGGSYTATILNGPASNASYSPLAALGANSFETFCLEPTEYFTPGGTYNYTINSFADGGANEAASRNIGPGDQLSKGTTWLYSQLAQGILTGFNYGAGRKDSNLLLQRAFWYLEDDYSYTLAQALANPFIALAAKHVANVAVADSASIGLARGNAANGENGVWALNLTSGTRTITKHQSQLYFEKVSVPEGGLTVVLLGASLLGLAIFRRRTVRA